MSRSKTTPRAAETALCLAASNYAKALDELALKDSAESKPAAAYVLALENLLEKAKAWAEVAR